MTEWRLFVYPVLAFAVLMWMRGLWRELQDCGGAPWSRSEASHNRPEGIRTLRGEYEAERAASTRSALLGGAAAANVTVSRLQQQRERLRDGGSDRAANCSD